MALPFRRKTYPKVQPAASAGHGGVRTAAARPDAGIGEAGRG
jgi:hypothetical protein